MTIDSGKICRDWKTSFFGLKNSKSSRSENIKCSKKNDRICWVCMRTSKQQAWKNPFADCVLSTFLSGLSIINVCMWERVLIAVWQWSVRGPFQWQWGQNDVVCLLFFTFNDDDNNNNTIHSINIHSNQLKHLFCLTQRSAWMVCFYSIWLGVLLAVCKR